MILIKSYLRIFIPVNIYDYVALANSKIGLSNTYYGDKVNVSNDESFSYQYEGYWKQKPETDMSIPGGAGSIVSKPTDLTKFIEALFSNKLVSTNSLEKMKTMTDGYGMGMFPIVFNTKKGYSHNGGIDGYASNLAYFPKDSLAIAYCSNGQAYPFKDILVGIRSICFNIDYSIPSFSINYITPDNLNNYLGIYLSTQNDFLAWLASD
jgi:D-alanyl-D-alanine carboxypeptidase